MGCANAKDRRGAPVSAEGGDRDVSMSEDAVLATARMQRRRLSLQETLVGDIEGKHFNPSRAANSPVHISMGPAVDQHTAAKLDLHKCADDVLEHLSQQHVGVSRKGYVPYNRTKVNQDAYFTHDNLFKSDDIHLYGVLDGHGEFGHHVSAFVSQYLIKAILSEGEEACRTDAPNALRRAVVALCQRLEKSRINTGFSGTTAVFSLQVGLDLYTANIGDSRCVLAQRQGEKVVAVPLSTDHKGEVESERQRILASGGRVETLPGPPDEDLGPLRVWLKNADIPGLAMTRSIGDKVCHSVGVISEPEVTLHRLSASDLFIVWASDGVWEFLSDQQVVDLLYPSISDLKFAANALVDAASAEWTQCESVIDDITCVVLSLSK